MMMLSILTSFVTESVGLSNKAELGPFLIVNPARTISNNGRAPIDIPQLFLGLSTHPNPNHPAPEGTFDLALVNSSTQAIKIRAQQIKYEKYVLEASASVESGDKGYLTVSEEAIPGLAKYRNFFFVLDPESFSQQAGKKTWYEDFNVLYEVVQPLEICIPGRRSYRPPVGGKFALVNENSSGGIETASSDNWIPVKLQLEKVKNKI